MPLIALSSRVRPRQVLVAAALLTAVAVLTYWPALSGDFVWDDDTLVTESTLVKAPDGLYRMWFTTEPLDYWPLTNTSFWFEWRVWGLHSTGYHVTNLLLHVASGLLLWTILGRLAIPGGLLAAVLFVVHPVNVESVAWIAQRKNTLSMCFFLVSILWYLRDRASSQLDQQPSKATSGKRRHSPPRAASTTSQPGTGPWYWLSLAAFVLAMLSKGSVAILPGVLLLIEWWRSGSISRAAVVRALPFFVIAAGLTLLNIWFQSHLMSGVIRDATLVQRVLGAAAIVWFYLFKAIAPVRLMFVYPQWIIRGDDVRWWLPLIAALATTWLLFQYRRRPMIRALLFTWLFFCLALLPVMGLTDVYYMRYSLVADHYEYLAVLGVIACVAAGAARLVELVQDPLAGASRAGRMLRSIGLNRPWGPPAYATVLALLLGAGAHAESLQYKNAETLYRSTLQRNPSSWLMHNLLGVRLVGTSLDEAVEHFREAVRLNPDLLEAHNNLCQAAESQGRHDEAMAECATAIRLGPNTATAHNGLGLTLSSRGRQAEARAEFETALRLNPAFAEAHINLGYVLAATGHESEAVEHYNQALGLAPESIDARRNLGLALDRLGKHDEAIEQYREVLRRNPGLADVRARLDALLRTSGSAEKIARYREDLRRHPEQVSLHASLGEALLEEGRSAEAIDEYKLALAGLPDTASVHFGLASSMLDAGEEAGAETHFRDAIRLKPDFADAHRYLGDLLLKRGRAEEAVEHYKSALATDPKAIEAHNNLGVALVRLGRRDEAIAQFKAALTIDPEYADARRNLDKTSSQR